MDELVLVKQEADRSRQMKDTCNQLSDRIERLQLEHDAASQELNRYQCNNDQLIKQNKVRALPDILQQLLLTY